MIGQRLKELRKTGGPGGQAMTQPEFAAIAGTSKQYVSQLESGTNQSPSAEFIERWAHHFGVRMEWITTGRLPKYASAQSADDGWMDVKAYAQAVGLGKGAEAQEYAETHALKFRAASLQRKGLRAPHLAVMYGDGDSMEPRIRKGDAILFDTSDTRPIDGAVFVIQWRGEVYAKRALLLDDVVYFSTDNPAGDHNWAKPKRMDAKRDPITILGRVRWIGSWEG